MFKLTQNPETSASASTEQSGAEPNMTADGSVKRGRNVELFYPFALSH